MKFIHFGSIVIAPILTLAALTIGLTTTPIQALSYSTCSDPGQCTCSNGIMTDHANTVPFNQIKNGCQDTPDDTFNKAK
jgi:hypothetical protein